MVNQQEVELGASWFAELRVALRRMVELRQGYERGALDEPRDGIGFSQ
jgi:hypothetical protein